MGIDQLDARKETLNNLLSFSGNPKALIIPSFQREYKWDSAHVLDLLKHTDPDDTAFGFLGTMVFVKDAKGHLEVVDGQQRLLSLVVILCALRDFIFDISKKIDDVDLSSKYAKISERSIQDETIYRSDPVSEEALVRVKFQRPSFSYIERVFLARSEKDASEAPLENEAKLFKKNYEVIYAALLEKYGTNTNFKNLLELLRMRIQKLRELVVNAIYINNPDYATEVFETINATGITLRLPDLVKNYLYKSLKHNAENDWLQIVANCGGKDADVERLIKYVWAIQFETTENEIFRSIRKHVENPQEFMARLLKASKIFRLLQNPSIQNYNLAGLVKTDPANYKTDIVDITENIANFKTIQYARLIFAVRFHAHEVMRIQDWVRLLKLIEAFQVRAFITKEAQTSRIEKLYGNFSRRLYQIHEEASNASYKESRIKSLLFEELPKEMLKLVPDDKFLAEFAAFKRSVSSTKEAKITKYIFAKIERYLSRNEVTIDYKNKSTTIEEVYPQSNSGWANDHDDISDLTFNIGNMTILQQKDNGAASNSQINSKLKIYTSSALRLNVELCDAINSVGKKWNRQSINSRARILAGYALSVWTLDTKLIKS